MNKQEQAASLIKSSINHALSGFSGTPDQIKEERLSICRSCEEVDLKQMKCKLCGCWMEVKAGWMTATCPLKKW